jgi:hypothetical protein
LVAHTATAVANRDIWWRQWVAPIALFLIGLGFYSINLGKPPRFDELYHVLGARGYLDFGEPRIADGVYERVQYFTAVVALLFDLFGESIAVGRLLAVVCGSLLVASLFVWVRAVAGQVAAWLAAIGFLISPFAAQVFQDLRFYAPQALLFWLGAIAAYAVSLDDLSSRRRALFAAAAVLAFSGALYLQPATLIGLVGIGLWLVGCGLSWLLRLERKLRLRALLALAPVALGAGGVVLALFGPEMIQRYRWTPLFDLPTRNQFWYYHFWLDLYYPTLWPLFPFVALAAVALRPRPALFCLAVFVPAVTLHAFAGPKSLLYMFYSMPFLFVLIGMGLASVAPRVIALGRELVDGAARALGITPRRWVRIAAFGAGLVFLLLANTANVRTAAMLAGITVPPEIPPADWEGVAPQLRPWLANAAVVLTGDELEALYYLDRFDVVVGKSRMSEMPDPIEFTRDPRTGRPVVSTPESVARIIDCFPSGLFVTDVTRWRNSVHIDDAIADAITARAERLNLPRSSRIVGFAWRHAAAGPGPATCAEIQRALHKETS